MFPPFSALCFPTNTVSYKLSGSSRSGLLHRGIQARSGAWQGTTSCCSPSGHDKEEQVQQQSLGSASHFQTGSQLQTLGAAGKPSQDQQDTRPSASVVSPGRDQRQGLEQSGWLQQGPSQPSPNSLIPGYSCTLSELSVKYKQPGTSWGAFLDMVFELF